MPVRDVAEAITFYTTQLGFALIFTDASANPGYAGVKREGVEIHLQWHASEEWMPGLDRPMIRVLCKDPDLLYTEFAHLLDPERSGLRNTPWGTREFGLYDPYQNALVFYRDI